MRADVTLRYPSSIQFAGKMAAIRSPPRSRLIWGGTRVFYNKYPTDKLHTIRNGGRRAHFYFCRRVEFMVDEWSFEPGIRFCLEIAR